MKTSFYIFTLILLSFATSCKKDNDEPDEPEQTDYRDCYEGTFDVDYSVITYTVSSGTSDTISELFVGLIAKDADSSIRISGGAYGDLIYKVDLSGNMSVCAGIDAGTVLCDQLDAQYILNGLNCPTLPNDISRHYDIAAVRQ